MKTYTQKLVKSFLLGLALLFVFGFACFPNEEASAATAPGQVTGVTQIDDGDNSITVSWDVVTGAQKYSVEYSADGTNWTTMSSSFGDTDRKITGLSHDSLYYVRVRAYNYDNAYNEDTFAYGPYSEVFVASTRVTGNVKNIQRTDNSDGSITFSWDAVPYANSYTISYWNQAVGKDSATTYRVTTTNTVLTGLALGNSYEINITPEHQTPSGYYTKNTNDSRVFDFETVPSQVKGLTQSSSTTSEIRLTWDEVAECEGYLIEYSTNKKTWTEVATVSYESYTVSNLKTATGYYFRVRAYNEAYVCNDADYKSEKAYTYGKASKVFAGATVPSKDPSTLKKTGVTKDTMTLKWSKVSGADGYVITYKYGTKTVKTKKTTKTSYTLKSLPKNSNITVQINSATIIDGKYYPTNDQYPDNQKTYSLLPGKVKNVEVPYYWQNIKELKVEFDRIKTLEYKDGYQIEVYTAYKSKDTKIKSVTTTSTSSYIESKHFSKHYMFKIRVRAYTKLSDGTKKYGSWSDWEYTCPQPDITTLKQSGKSIKMAWDTIKGAEKYAVYVSTKKDSGYKKVTETTKTSYTLSKFNKKSLKKGTTYYVYIVPLNKEGKKYNPVEAGNSYYCWPVTYK